jgi:hypothetical protein
MITDFLAKAVEIGADRIEIEHKDRAELVTAFHGPVGVGIAWVDATHWDALFQETQDLKKLGREGFSRKATLTWIVSSRASTSW